MEYKLQFNDDATSDEIQQAQAAGTKLLYLFKPLFKKYAALITTGKINFEDKEIKRFVSSFIGDCDLKLALKRQHATSKYCHPINQKFAFVTETYGKCDPNDIMSDLQMLFLVLVKRYKQMGKNFCAYLYNSYGYEVSRHIKKYTKNPVNIPYRNVEYEDFMQTYSERAMEDCFEDKIYENSQGIPDSTWMSGESCSDLFRSLSKEERKLIIKYYMEDYNDRQIAEEFSMHINTVNQKRRKAVNKLASILGVDPKSIQRSRNSGKKALFTQ